ncbi:MAG: class II glutamine amidotransferase [Candidatus Omnitrophota bacterium]
MCGIFGIYGHPEAARLAYLGIYALQHRGEESAGVVSYNGKKVKSCKGVGLVGDVFDEAKIKGLSGHIAIGHNRYSTTGSSLSKNIQPFLVNYRKSPIAIAHNGNFTNTAQLYERLEKQGAIFQTTTDSELIIHLLTRSQKSDYRDNLASALNQVQGAYSLVLMIGDILIGARDPHGFRPLCLGKLNNAYVLASETCALDLIQAEYIREIEPGEIVFIGKQGIESIKPFVSIKHSLCIFEYIYFARPDSNIFNHNVYLVRKQLGEALAREHPSRADLVMPIPDSGTSAALGFAKESGIAYE